MTKVPASKGALINNRLWRPETFSGKTVYRGDKGRFVSKEQFDARIAEFQLNELKATALAKKIETVIQNKMNSTQVAKESRLLVKTLKQISTNRVAKRAGGNLVISVPQELQLSKALDSKLKPAMAVEAMHTQWGLISNLLKGELLIWAESIQQILSERLEKKLIELAYIDPITFKVITGEDAGTVIERAANTSYQRTGRLEESFSNLINLYGEGSNVSLVVDIGKLQASAPYWIYVEKGHRVTMFLKGSGMVEAEMPARNFLQGAIEDLHSFLNQVLVPQIAKLYQQTFNHISTWVTDLDKSSKIVSLAPEGFKGGITGFSTRQRVGMGLPRRFR